LPLIGTKIKYRVRDERLALRRSGLSGVFIASANAGEFRAWLIMPRNNIPPLP